MTNPPELHLVDDVLVASDAASRDPTKALVERQVDRVEERRDVGDRLTRRLLVVGRGFENSGPIEVRCCTLR